MTVREVHEVTFRDALRAEPYDDVNGCCEAVPAADAAPALIAALGLLARRLRPA